MLISRIVEESGQTRAQIARDSGLNENTLASWMAGRRNPTPDSIRQLAQGLRSRAKALLDLADEVEQKGGA